MSFWDGTIEHYLMAGMTDEEVLDEIRAETERSAARMARVGGGGIGRMTLADERYLRGRIPEIRADLGIPSPTSARVRTGYSSADMLADLVAYPGEWPAKQERFAEHINRTPRTVYEKALKYGGWRSMVELANRKRQEASGS